MELPEKFCNPLIVCILFMVLMAKYLIGHQKSGTTEKSHSVQIYAMWTVNIREYTNMF